MKQPPKAPPRDVDSFSSSRLFAPLLIVLVAVVGFLPVLQTWWLADDWGFLADAAGVADSDTSLARWISFKVYWHLFYPFLGLSSAAWAVTRLLLHAGSALLVARLAGRLGLPPSGSLLAGLLFAANPGAFESVYWGSGVVELLGAFFTLAALERWLARGRFHLLWSTLLAAASILSKETGLWLPLFFAWSLARRRERSLLPWLATAGLGILVVIAALAVRSQLLGVPEYELSVTALPTNLARLSCWLVVPSPVTTLLPGGRVGEVVIGILVFGGWGYVVFAARRAATAWPSIALLAALASVLPVALLDHHLTPRYTYTAAAAVALIVAWLVERGGAGVPARVAVLLAMVLTANSLGTYSYFTTARHRAGRPVHHLVLKEELSRSTCMGLRQINLGGRERVVFVSDPHSDPVQERILRDAIGGTLGPRLILGGDVGVMWVDELSAEDRDAYLLRVDGLNISPRGP
jgi:hypothetical protein